VYPLLAVGIAAASVLNEASTLILTDISEKALLVAENEKYINVINVEDRVEAIHSDMFKVSWKT